LENENTSGTSFTFKFWLWRFPSLVFRAGLDLMYRIMEVCVGEEQ
jgi:hypothetical protein